MQLIIYSLLLLYHFDGALDITSTVFHCNGIPVILKLKSMIGCLSLAFQSSSIDLTESLGIVN